MLSSAARWITIFWILLLSLASGTCPAAEPVAIKLTELSTESEVMALAFSPDGVFLAVEEFNKQVQVWDVSKRRRVAAKLEGGVPLGEHELEFSPDGRFLLTCHGGDTSLHVYDTAHWKAARTMPMGPAHGARGCEGASFSPDSKQLIRMQDESVIDPGSDLVFYDTSSWLVAASIRTQPYIAGRENVDGLDLCREALSQVIDRVFLEPKDVRRFFVPFPERGFSISADGRYLALAGHKGFLCNPGERETFKDDADGKDYVAILDLVDRKFVRLIEAGTESIDWNPSGLRLAMGPYAGRYGGVAAGPIRIIDIKTGRTLVSEVTGEAHVHLRYTRDSKYLIESIGKKVEIWDQSHVHLRQTIREESCCLAVSADGRFLALGGAQATLVDSPASMSHAVHALGPKGKVIVYQLH